MKARIRAIDKTAIIQPLINRNDHVWDVETYEEAITIFDDWREKNKDKKDTIWQLMFEIET